MWYVLNWITPKQRDDYPLELAQHFVELAEVVRELEASGFVDPVQNSFALVAHDPLPEALRDHAAWLRFLAAALPCRSPV